MQTQAQSFLSYYKGGETRLKNPSSFMVDQTIN